VITYKVRRDVVPVWGPGPWRYVRIHLQEGDVVFVLDPPLSESRGYHFCLLESGTMGEVTCDVVERS